MRPTFEPQDPDYESRIRESFTAQGAMATMGITLRWSQLPSALEVFRVVPWIAAGALVVFAGFVYFFRSRRFAGSGVRERHLAHAFSQSSPWQYATILVIRSPALPR